jgi:site-specific DNA-methyltransferase (adenine-specific)
MNSKIILGDCLDVMKEMAENSIDFIVTDPPYGLNFMGKDWDKSIPNQEIWAEALRICKPGSMLAAFGGSRTHHHLMIALEKSGWEIRDVIMWLYGSGFPKSHNKFGLEGYGTALKPAYEPIILAMKPLDGTFAQNAEKWGLAGINIQECRIETSELKPYSPGLHKDSPSTYNDDSWIGKDQIKLAPSGRWPANLILDEEAAEMLDEQSGISKSNSGGITFRKEETKQLKGLGKTERTGHNDCGGASRFFYCAKSSSKERNAGLEGMPLKESRPLGISNWEGQTNGSGQVMGKSNPQSNFHPTVKPISLMKYILKLLASPGNPICLDPFAGSGSTLLAAQELGINCIGIEKMPEYHEIAQKRISNAA